MSNDYIRLVSSDWATTTTGSTGDFWANWTIPGTTGTWAFSPPGNATSKDEIWRDMIALSDGTLELSYEDLLQLIEQIEIHGEFMGKLRFILSYR